MAGRVREPLHRPGAVKVRRRSPAHILWRVAGSAHGQPGENLTVDHCYFNGGLITVNTLDSSLGQSINVSITNSVFANDMRNGHTGGPSTKGYAVAVPAGKSLAAFEGNTWTDGSPVEITRV